MSMRAAVLVDAENISGKQHMLDVHEFLESSYVLYQAQIQEFAVHGTPQTHRWWKHSAYLISYHPHSGGKNAADKQICQHALKLFVEQGISLFYLVSNDKHLAAVADQLETKGCSVFCLGTELAARALQNRVDFFRLDQRITLVCGATTPSDPLLQGGTMVNSYFNSSSQVAVEQLTPRERVERALQTVYQGDRLPTVYSRFLTVFLEWAIKVLCVEEPEDLIMRTPKEVAAMLKDMEQDPLLSTCLTVDVRPHWDAVYAFAKRCEYIYACGYKDATLLINHAPHMTTTTLLQAYLEKNGHEWEHLFSPNLPNEQQDFFRFVEKTEQIIWYRWYGRGMEQGAQEMRETRQNAWRPKFFDFAVNTDHLPH